MIDANRQLNGALSLGISRDRELNSVEGMSGVADVQLVAWITV